MIAPVPDEPAHLVRLYRPEWCIVYTASSTSGGYGPAELKGVCEEHYRTRYEGRVRPEDAKIMRDGPVVRLLLLLPTLKGEFKYETLAKEWAEEQGWDTYDIVGKESPEDHELRSYSVKMLPA